MNASGVRIGWKDLPGSVRAFVEDVLKGPVVEAVSQRGGFSPGTADRVRTADGRRAFVKAVSADLNEHSPGLHRREARITAALPPSLPVPQLLGVHDDGNWVALVLSDVEGRNPRTPWRARDLPAVLDTLADLAEVTLDDLPAAVDVLTEDFTGWQRLADDPPDDLDPWAAANLDLLVAAADRGIAALDGSHLAHMDIRADNLILGPTGITIVDWPWAARGPSWLDPTMLLTNVRLHGGHDCAALLTEIAQAHDADRDDLLAVLAGFAGFFAEWSRHPPPPGLPTVRAFQRAQGDALRAWLADEFRGR